MTPKMGPAVTAAAAGGVVQRSVPQEMPRQRRMRTRRKFLRG